MYQGKMAFAVKVAGKILREHGEQVFLPFGSEYSLLIKNLNNRRACVSITLDGQEVVDGGLVVGANSTVDLERFIKEGQFDKGNRFKFIERTGKVEATRGIGLEDGILRVEFEFEKEIPKYVPTTVHHHHTYRYGGMPTIYGSIGTLSNSTLSASGSIGDFVGGAAAASSATYDSFDAPMERVRARSLSSPGVDVPVKDASNVAGITVAGSVSEQKFVSTTFNGDGITSVMVLRLLGKTEAEPVKAPVTVKTKQKCTTCGHMNKATAKFCSECGTGLEIV